MAFSWAFRSWDALSISSALGLSGAMMGVGSRKMGKEDSVGLVCYCVTYRGLWGELHINIYMYALEIPLTIGRRWSNADNLM
jgi:hypothetical protein